MDDVHSGVSGFASLLCDDAGGSGLTYSLDARRPPRLGVRRRQRRRQLLPQPRRQGPGRLHRPRGRQRGRKHDRRRSRSRWSTRRRCATTSLRRAPDRHLGCLPRLLRPRGRPLRRPRRPGRNGTSDVAFGSLVYPPTPASPAPTASTTTRATPSRAASPRRPPSPSPTPRRSARPGRASASAAPHRQADHAPHRLLRHRRRRGPIAADDAPDHGTLGAFTYNPSSGCSEATYTPAAGYTGPDAFTFTAADGIVSSGPHDFDLTITPNHAPPCSHNGTFHAKRRPPAPIFFFCSDEDAQDQELAYTPVPGSGPDHGPIDAPRDFQVDYTPTPASPARTASPSARPTATSPTPRAGHPRRGHAAVLDAVGCPGPLRPELQIQVDCTVPQDDFGPFQYEIGTPPTKGTLTRPGTSFSAFRTYTREPGRRRRRPLHGAPHRLHRLEPVRHPAITTGAAVNNAPDCDDAARFRADRLPRRPAGAVLFCSDPDGDQVDVRPRGEPAHGTVSSERRRGHATPATPATWAPTRSVHRLRRPRRHRQRQLPVDVRAPEAPACSPDPISRPCGPARPAAPALLLQPAGRPADLLGPDRARQGHAGHLRRFRPRHLHGRRGRARGPTRSRCARPTRSAQRPVAVTITIDPELQPRADLLRELRPEARCDRHGDRARPRRRL